MNRHDYYKNFGVDILAYELDNLARERMVSEVLVAVAEESLEQQIPTLVALIRDNEQQTEQIAAYVSEACKSVYEKVEASIQDEYKTWQQSKPTHDDFVAGTLELALKNNTVTTVEALLYAGNSDSLMEVVNPYATDKDKLLLVLLYTELQ